MTQNLGRILIKPDTSEPEEGIYLIDVHMASEQQVMCAQRLNGEWLAGDGTYDWPTLREEITRSGAKATLQSLADHDREIAEKATSESDKALGEVIDERDDLEHRISSLVEDYAGEQAAEWSSVSDPIDSLREWLEGQMRRQKHHNNPEHRVCRVCGYIAGRTAVPTDVEIEAVAKAYFLHHIDFTRFVDDFDGNANMQPCSCGEEFPNKNTRLRHILHELLLAARKTVTE